MGSVLKKYAEKFVILHLNVNTILTEKEDVQYNRKLERLFCFHVVLLRVWFLICGARHFKGAYKNFREDEVKHSRRNQVCLKTYTISFCNMTSCCSLLTKFSAVQCRFTDGA
jgi:hypothetical protein